MRGRLLGQRGERLAADFLRSRGYTLVSANARTRWGEIDLVARDGTELVFIEVKTRRTGGSVSGEQAMTPRKLRQIESLAVAYLTDRGLEQEPWRVEMVSVEIDQDGAARSLRLVQDLG